MYYMERVVQLFVKGPSFPFTDQLCFVSVDRIMCVRGAVTYLCTQGRSDCSLLLISINANVVEEKSLFLR